MFGINLTVWQGVAVGLCILGAIVFSLVAWFLWDRWEYGKPEGAHAATRSFRGAPQAVRLPYLECGSYASVPEPPLVLSEAVLAATAGRPWLVNDIRIERTRNLPGAADVTAAASLVGHRPPGRVGEPTNQSMGYWKPNGKDIADVLPARVIAALTGAKADDTVTSGATFQRWVRDFLTCDLADLPLAVRADKLGLGVGVRP